MAQIFDAPSKAILRSQIAEHIAETDKNDKRELQAGEEPLPNDRFFDRELSWLKFNKRVLELAQDEDLPIIERRSRPESRRHTSDAESVRGASPRSSRTTLTSSSWFASQV
jgi:transglutaminase/protease-like cytokinesis protein 3